MTSIEAKCVYCTRPCVESHYQLPESLKRVCGSVPIWNSPSLFVSFYLLFESC